MIGGDRSANVPGAVDRGIVGPEYEQVAMILGQKLSERRVAHARVAVRRILA
jgi:hypothetical protein